MSNPQKSGAMGKTALQQVGGWNRRRGSKQRQRAWPFICMVDTVHQLRTLMTVSCSQQAHTDHHNCNVIRSERKEKRSKRSIEVPNRRKCYVVGSGDPTKRRGERVSERRGRKTAVVKCVQTKKTNQKARWRTIPNCEPNSNRWIAHEKLTS